MKSAVLHNRILAMYVVVVAKSFVLDQPHNTSEATCVGRHIVVRPGESTDILTFAFRAFVQGRITLKFEKIHNALEGLALDKLFDFGFPLLWCLFDVIELPLLAYEHEFYRQRFSFEEADCIREHGMSVSRVMISN